MISTNRVVHFSLPVSVCACVHVYVYVHVHSPCAGACGGRRRMSSVVFNYTFSLFFEKGSLTHSTSSSLCRQTEWPVSPQDSLPSASRAWADVTVPRFLCGHCESELRSSWPHSKHFTHSATIPDLKLWLWAAIKAKWKCCPAACSIDIWKCFWTELGILLILELAALTWLNPNLKYS